MVIPGEPCPVLSTSLKGQKREVAGGIFRVEPDGEELELGVPLGGNAKISHFFLILLLGSLTF